MTFYAKVAEIEKSINQAALCIVVDKSGSAPRKASAKMIVIANGTAAGEIIGTVGGGAIEHLVRERAIEAIRLQRPLLFTTSLRNELGMCCGGEMTIYIEPLTKKMPFICFGAGHISQSLCPLVGPLGFDVIVVDGRKELLDAKAFHDAKRIDDSSIFVLRDLPLHEQSFVLVATHSHELDQEIVEGLLGFSFKYAGLVGSKRKALMTKKRLLAKGYSSSDMERVICPAGIDIKAETPAEIAVSILAQLICIKNG